MPHAVYKHAAGELKRYDSSVAREPGDVEVVGSRIGVVVGCSPIAAGDDYTLRLDGVHDMDAKTTDDWADGAQLYWDATNEELTDTAGSNKTAGLAVGAKTNGQTRADCDINASASTTVIT